MWILSGYYFLSTDLNLKKKVKLPDILPNSSYLIGWEKQNTELYPTNLLCSYHPSRNHICLARPNICRLKHIYRYSFWIFRQIYLTTHTLILVLEDESNIRSSNSRYLGQLASDPSLLLNFWYRVALVT